MWTDKGKDTATLDCSFAELTPDRTQTADRDQHGHGHRLLTERATAITPENARKPANRAERSGGPRRVGAEG